MAQRVTVGAWLGRCLAAAFGLALAPGARAQVIRPCALPAMTPDVDSGYVTSMRVIRRADTLWREAPVGSRCLSGQLLHGDTLEVLRSLGGRVEVLSTLVFDGDSAVLAAGRPLGRQQTRALLYTRSTLLKLRYADAIVDAEEAMPHDECTRPPRAQGADTGYVITTRQWRRADTLWSENPPHSGCVVGQLLRHDTLTMLRTVRGRAEPPLVYTFYRDSIVFLNGEPLAGRRATLLLMQLSTLKSIAESDSAMMRRGGRRSAPN